MKFDTVIRNGIVVTGTAETVMDIGIRDGKIVAMGIGLAEEHEASASAAPEALGVSKPCEVIDASGCYVLPGTIDAHIHLCEPGRTEWEGFETGTKACAAGGVTCYIDMPLNNLPAVTGRKSLELKKASAEGKNYVDYALYGGLVPNNIDRLAEQDAGGVCAYKCFTASCGFDGVEDDFRNIDDYTLYKGMEEIARLGQILSVHCENRDICDKLAEDAKAEGRTGLEDYLNSRPIAAEVEAVRRVLYFAEVTGCRVHLVHLSCAEAVREVTAAKSRGVKATCETCAHYLALSRKKCVEEIGAVSKCSPPIRDEAEQEKLWNELFKGNIDMVTSDHSPCPPEMKFAGGGDMFAAWGGISGCQNTLDIMFDEAVLKRKMKPHALMRLLAYNPARVFRMKDKGEIAVGKDADIAILDPRQSYTLTSEDLYYRYKLSPYIGREIGCRVVKTFVRGTMVFDIKKGICAQPAGKFVSEGQEGARGASGMKNKDR